MAHPVLTDSAASQVGAFEVSQKPVEASCKSCGLSIGSQYYRVNGAAICLPCAQRAKLHLPESSNQPLVRGLAFGAGGALVGFLLCCGFGNFVGAPAAYLSLPVAYLVGKSMMRGSYGIGGRPYQLAAILMTYVAISLAAIPATLSHASLAATPVTRVLDVGFASPFLGWHGALRGAMVSLALALSFVLAWKLAAGTPLQILGPFRKRTAPD